MEWVETTGRTIEEAKDTALDQLGEDAEFEILEEPKLGLFGRLRAEARVRARVRPTTPRPKDDRRDRRRKRPSGEAGGVGTIESAEQPVAVAAPPDNGTDRPSTDGRVRSRATSSPGVS